MDEFARGNAAVARDIQHRILLLNHAVTKGFGIPGLKAALEALGLFGGNCRPPLPRIGLEARTEVVKLLEATGLLGGEAWI